MRGKYRRPIFYESLAITKKCINDGMFNISDTDALQTQDSLLADKYQPDDGQKASCGLDGSEKSMV